MRSDATPAATADSYEQRTNAAAWSTSRVAHMRFVYGEHAIRLSGDGSQISSGVYAAGDHAYGLRAATAASRDHRSPIARWCASTVWPDAWRIAVSNSGYTWV